MQLQFRASAEQDRARIAAANRRLAELGHLSSQTSVETMRSGTAAIAGNDLVRQPPAGVHIEAGTLAGLRCETYRTDQATAGARIVYLHGGGFTRGSLALGRANAATLALESGVAVTAVAYRQAPEHRYPAASDDVFAVWQALRNEGLEAAQIALVGESSGGCLALGLLVTLSAQPSAPPAGIAALMPMTDLELAGASWLFNADKDVADLATGRRLVDLYIDAAQRREPLASPVRHHFRGSCPLFIGIGGHDTMLSDAERTAHRAADAGVDVALHLYEAMPHGFTRFDVPIANQALRDAATWCAARLRLGSDILDASHRRETSARRTRAANGDSASA